MVDISLTELDGTPLVAGGLALYNELKPDDNELIFGNLMNSVVNGGTIYAGNIDLAAVEAEPAPELAPISAIYRDSINGQNGNGLNQVKP